MESTGGYWVPVYEILEEHGFEVVLSNACGLLKASFRPEAAIAELCAYMRVRERLLDYAAAHIQHMQKALTYMNIQLSIVVSDISGVTGMKIVRAIVAGEKDPNVLAKFRDPRCKADEQTISATLNGNYQPEHLFALRQAVLMYDAYQLRVDECDVQIESVLNSLCMDSSYPVEPIPKPKNRTKQPNAMTFDVREKLYRLIGTDLTQIHGIGPFLALRLISECGTDMNNLPTEKHFTSWLTLCPGSKISGGKVMSSHSRKSNNRVVAHLWLAATTVGRSDTVLGAFYRRLSSRVGKAKAVTATARKIAILFYNAMKYGTKYQDPGAEYYEKRYKERVIKKLKRQAERMGMFLQAKEECVS
ncbi:transposase [Providencia sp. R1]